MKLQRPFGVRVFVSMAILLAVSSRAFAGPDEPEIDGLNVHFTGNQSWGIWPASSWFSPPVWGGWKLDPTFTYQVDTLSTDITPASGVPGIKLTRYASNGADGGDSDLWDLTAGGNGEAGTDGFWLTVPYIMVPVTPEVVFQEDSFQISTSGTGAHGISVESVGGRGGQGGSDDAWVDAVGGRGGDGGDGNRATVTSAGTIHTSGDSSFGIHARSQGGDGGEGGSAESA
ncbi:MAG: hypothetical protein M1376_05585, partial [Planctomycetes bacterium]|nr:hypothetical protein [Planctomycetota bacterium]